MLRQDALIAIVKIQENEYESITVFVPYCNCQAKAKIESKFYGDMHIVYSWNSTYKLLERQNSGLYTGIPLPGEEFIIATSKLEAIKQANSLSLRQKKPSIAAFDLNSWINEAL